MRAPKKKSDKITSATEQKRKWRDEDRPHQDNKRPRDDRVQDRHYDRPYHSQDRPSYRPRYNGRHQGRSDRATPCRLCGDPAIIGHLDVCPFLAKRTAIYNNKENGADASRHAPNNYTGNFSQRRRSFEDKLHQENASNRRVNQVETAPAETTMESEHTIIHPADAVMEEILEETNLTPFQAAMKRVQNPEKSTKGNFRGFSLKTKEEKKSHNASEPLLITYSILVEQ
ncbi:hypothetical protein G6F56_012966 [Rhizopus delemar]|nr:hypothetical protein G6F56_012966 [Rhizopus delemar]